MQLRLVYGSATDRGLQRAVNEDALLAEEPIFAVADGMGGHESGDVASSISVRALAACIGDSGSTPVSEAIVAAALLKADAEIREVTGGRAGTTLTGVVFVADSEPPCWIFFNIGDSRAYLLRKSSLVQVTVDHSEVQELVDAGWLRADEAPLYPRRNVITRALGTGSDTDPDFWRVPVEPGDRVLVCSDGLTGELPHDRILHVLTNVSGPEKAAAALVAETLRAGARDNVSAVVVDAVDPAVGA